MQNLPIKSFQNFTYGVHLMAKYTSVYAPTYEYFMTYDNSFGFLHRYPIPSKTLFLFSKYTFFITLLSLAHGFDIGVTHTDELQLLAKLQEDSLYETVYVNVIQKK